MVPSYARWKPWLKIPYTTKLPAICSVTIGSTSTHKAQSPRLGIAARFGFDAEQQNIRGLFDYAKDVVLLKDDRRATFSGRFELDMTIEPHSDGCVGWDLDL